jgi:hypothetical protein
MTIYYTRGDLARSARVTNQAIVYAERRGEITPIGKTVRGMALYDQAQSERFLKNRAQANRN